MKEFIIDGKTEGQRLDKFLFRLLNNSTNSFVYKMLRKKNITLNDKKADGKEVLSSGDTVKLWFSDETFEKFSNKEMDGKDYSIDNNYTLNIIYEDKDVILINKPVGVLSQKADINDISINELLIDYLMKKGELKKEDFLIYKPSVVNRLDRNTSGIIVGAKTLKAAQILSEGFKNRSINKYYKCLVHGTVKEGKNIKGYLSKENKSNKVYISDKKEGDESHYIETEYSPIISKDDLSLLDIHLITGKTHQIRAHLSSVGYPLAGDKKYGVKDSFRFQCLHCYKIVFPNYDGILEGISGKEFYGNLEKPWTSWINS